MRWFASQVIACLLVATATLAAFGHCPVLASVSSAVIAAHADDADHHGHQDAPLVHTGLDGRTGLDGHENPPQVPRSDDCAFDLTQTGAVQVQAAATIVVKPIDALGIGAANQLMPPVSARVAPTLRDQAARYAAYGLPPSGFHAVFARTGRMLI